MTQTTSYDSQHQPAVYKSLGLPALLRFLQSDRKYAILDLGPALGINVEFWSQFQCRLHIEDFYHGYRTNNESVAAESRESVLAELLPFNDDTSFDVILAWDLFNYLDTEELEALVRRLSKWCRQGTLLFALISSLPRIPSEPILFKILDSEQMVYETRTAETRPCPRHQPRDLVRLMAGFKVSSSFLLRHGIQEYVFVYSQGMRE